MTYMTILAKHDIGLQADGAHLFVGRVKCMGRLVDDLDHGTGEACISTGHELVRNTLGNAQMKTPTGDAGSHPLAP